MIALDFVASLSCSCMLIPVKRHVQIKKKKKVSTSARDRADLPLSGFETTVDEKLSRLILS